MAARKTNTAAAPSASTARSAPQVVKLYQIIGDAIIKPEGAGEWTDQVSEDELRGAGADVAWLLESGAVVDRGFVQVNQ